jgi:hypothetical protein
MLDKLRVFLALALCSCGGSGSGGTNVNGTVLSGANRIPEPGASVLITDANKVQTSVKTDATGAFSVSGVATPYSAAVVDPASQTATVYLGLTRNNPALISDTTSSPVTNRQSTLAITLSGGTYPQPPANYTTNYLFVSPWAFQSAALMGTLLATNSLQFSWLDPSSTTTSGTLWALQVLTDDSGLPIGYPGYGSTSATLTDAETTTASLSLASVTNALLTGTVTPPPGYSVDEVDGLLLFPNGYNITMFADTTASTSLSYTTPSIPSTTLALSVAAYNSSGAIWLPYVGGLAADATGVTFDCPGAPTLIAPTDQQTGVTTSTAFSWSVTPSAIYNVSFTINQSGLMVWTADASLTLPDLSSIGFGPFPSTVFNWLVSAQTGFTSIDAVTDPALSVPTGLSCDAVSPSQDFTTAG